MSEITDFHQLDECDCGGRLDCWTTFYSLDEARLAGFARPYHRTEWSCPQCGHVSDRYHDEDMNDVTSEWMVGMEE